MPMLDLDIAKTKTLIDELRYAGDQARKANDITKAKDIDTRYNTAVAKLRSLQAIKASVMQNGGTYYGRGEVPHPETPYRAVGPSQAVGGRIVQGVGMKMKAKTNPRSKKRKINFVAVRGYNRTINGKKVRWRAHIRKIVAVRKK